MHILGVKRFTFLSNTESEMISGFKTGSFIRILD